MTQKSNRGKLITFGVIAITVVVLTFLFRDTFSLENLAEHESRLRELRESNPLLIYGLAFLIYVAVAGLAIPGAAGLSLVYAWFFGFWPALVLISFASTLGATISFLLSRYLLRETIQSRFSGRLRLVNENLKKDGAFYLFTLRLIPAIPFFIINVVMGLTPIKTWTFWWVSQIGMIPGTAVYTWAGSSVPSLQKLAEQGVGAVLSWKVIAAFVLLGLFPTIVKAGTRALSSKKDES